MSATKTKLLNDVKGPYWVIRNPLLGEIDWLSAYRNWNRYFYKSAKNFTPKRPLEGYYAFGSERALGADAQDEKEFFHLFGSTSRNSVFPEFTQEIFEVLSMIARDVSSLIDSTWSVDIFHDIKNSKSMVLRVSRYPEQVKGKIVNHTHTDANYFTVLPMASVAGLEICNCGVAQTPNIDCNQAVVFFGDMLNERSNGNINATQHRVRSPGAKRLSFSFFANPDEDIKINSKGLTAGEFLSERVNNIIGV